MVGGTSSGTANGVPAPGDLDADPAVRDRHGTTRVDADSVPLDGDPCAGDAYPHPGVARDDIAGASCRTRRCGRPPR